MPVGNHTLPTDVLDSCTDGFIYCYSRWSSDVTTGLFWFLALFSFTLVLFLATTGRYGTPRAFGFASFVGLIGGIWLAVLQLIPWWVGSTFIIVGVIGLAGMFISDKK